MPPTDDDRFAELIAREFGQRVDPPEPEGFRTWVPAEEPDEPFVPPARAPAGPWHPMTILGTVLIGLGVLAVVLSAAGVRLSWIWGLLAGGAVMGGTALLLIRLSKRPPSDSDGAVV